MNASTGTWLFWLLLAANVITFAMMADLFIRRVQIAVFVVALIAASLYFWLQHMYSAVPFRLAILSLYPLSIWLNFHVGRSVYRKLYREEPVFTGRGTMLGAPGIGGWWYRYPNWKRVRLRDMFYTAYVLFGSLVLLFALL